MNDIELKELEENCAKRILQAQKDYRRGYIILQELMEIVVDIQQEVYETVTKRSIWECNNG